MIKNNDILTTENIELKRRLNIALSQLTDARLNIERSNYDIGVMRERGLVLDALNATIRHNYEELWVIIANGNELMTHKDTMKELRRLKMDAEMFRMQETPVLLKEIHEDAVDKQGPMTKLLIDESVLRLALAALNCPREAGINKTAITTLKQVTQRAEKLEPVAKVRNDGYIVALKQLTEGQTLYVIPDE